MRLQESETVELKHTVVDEIKKEIVAFANSNGGTERPYYIAAKGLRPEGVYVQHGSSSVPATDTAIRRMIRETDGESYECLRSLEQELSFAAAETEFAERQVEFSVSQMTTLGLMSADRIYSNLGLLLSDQCFHSVKAAVFQDNTQQIFKDRREFSGSLFKQMNETYEFLDFHNQTTATFDRLRRIDTRDYPEAALREALLNAVVHREYATGGSILIKMFADRVEFISPGGLFGGIELDDIMSGYSVCRNSALAGVFYRLRLIKAYGTGVLKIFEAYKGFLAQPKIELTPNVFKMILPNLNAVASSVTAPTTDKTPEERILRFVRENGSISRKETEQLLGMSQTFAGQVLRRMVEDGGLVKKGGSRSTVYLLPR